MKQIEHQIFDQVRTLNGNQKEEVLDYLETFQRRHNTRIYRRKAMRQIREAISNQD